MDRKKRSVSLLLVLFLVLDVPVTWEELKIRYWRRLVFRKDYAVPVIFMNSTGFELAPGNHRLRILVVGGGDGGCGGKDAGRGERGCIFVSIKHISSTHPINVTVGRGGLGSNSRASPFSKGMPSSFGDDVTSDGGSCIKDVNFSSLEKIHGIRHFVLSTFKRGNDGANVVIGNQLVQGGEGGILVNNTGPNAGLWVARKNATGGVGFGAGGGSGGKSLDRADPQVFKGGPGAPGVVYIEIVPRECQKAVDVVFAIEARGDKDEFKKQRTTVIDLIESLAITRTTGRVGVIMYGKKAEIKIDLATYKNRTTLLNNIFSLHNDASLIGQIMYSNLFATSFIALSRSSEDRVKKKNLIVFTFGGNITDKVSFNQNKHSLLSSGVTIIVVGLAEKGLYSNVRGIVNEDENVYTAIKKKDINAELHNHVPWIADTMCTDQLPVKPIPTVGSSPITTADKMASTPIRTPSTATTMQTTSKALLTSTVPNTSRLPSTLNTTSPALNVSTSASSVFTTPSVTWKTPQELLNDFNVLMGYDFQRIDLSDMDEIYRVISLAEDVMQEGYRIPNASETAPELRVLNFVENYCVRVSEKMELGEESYSTMHLSRDSMGLAIVSVNLTTVDELRLSDIIYFGEGDPLHYGEATIPLEAFSKNKRGVGSVVWVTYNPLAFMDYDNDSKISSRVMDIEVAPRTNSTFKSPIELVFRLSESQEPGHVRECVFWNPNQRGVNMPHGSWSTAGCKVAKQNRTSVTCHCYHLTSFAVLTKLNRNQRSSVHDKYLSTITYVGCSLSMLGCVLTILTHLFLPSLRSDRAFIHINLVTAILFAQVMFFVAALVHTPYHVCYAAAVALFFFYMSVFMWMLVEGLHIYFLIIQVFNSGLGRRKFYVLIGWGIPFVMTILSTAAFRKDFLSKTMCWLSVESGAIWSFIGPAILVIAINLVILLMVLRVTAGMLKDESQTSSKALVKAFVTLLPILGLTWLFGFLAFNNKTVVFEYLFAIFNSLQGLLIFIFYCLLSSEVRREFSRKMHNFEVKRSLKNSYNPGSATSPTPRLQMGTMNKTKYSEPNLKSLRECYDTRL